MDKKIQNFSEVKKKRLENICQKSIQPECNVKYIKATYLSVTTLINNKTIFIITVNVFREFEYIRTKLKPIQIAFGWCIALCNRNNKTCDSATQPNKWIP